MDDNLDDTNENVEPRTEAVAEELREKPPEAFFIGDLHLVPNSGPINDFLPVAYRNHELIRGQYFYTLPPRLIQEVCAKLDQDAFDADLLYLEAELSRISGDHESQFGFWRNRGIRYNLLRRYPVPVPNIEWAQAHGWDYNKIEFENQIRRVNERIPRFVVVSRGFAGWLMTNPQFLDEHDALMAEYGEQVRTWGTQLLGIPNSAQLSPESLDPAPPPGLFEATAPPEFSDPTTEVGWDEYEAAFVAFLVRWRLRGLAGPGLPVPMEPMMGGAFPLTILQQLMKAGGVFNWPDTFPVLSRDELRDILEDALRGDRRADHLAGWMEIVQRSNQAKNQITRNGRLFALQHFWRLLYLRHPAAMEGQIHRLETAFASYFEVSEETIHADLIVIRRRIGQDWTSRGTGSSHPSQPR